MSNEGSVTAVFESSTFLTIAASNSILSVRFAGDNGTLFNVAKGLLGKINLD